MGGVGLGRRAWVAFKEPTVLELVTSSQLPTQRAQTHKYSEENNTLTHMQPWLAEKKEIDCGGSLLLSYKPVSFMEGRFWLPALPGASSISVMGGCGDLHRAPVNFNYINLPLSSTEGVLGLYISLKHWLQSSRKVFLENEGNHKYCCKLNRD